MKTYNIGMAGSGFMGKAHTYAYKAIPFFYGELPIKVNLRAICSLPLEDAQKAAKEYGYDIATADPDEFFNSGLDIVHVCTPNDMHKPFVMEAVKRGIHVYCEKPFAMMEKKIKAQSWSVPVLYAGEAAFRHVAALLPR